MKLLIILILSIVSLASFSAERKEFYVGIRGLSMGGAQVATVNDETSLLVNPAGLGKLRNYFITVADPELHLGDATQAIVGTDVTAPLDPQAVLDLFNKATNQDKILHSKFHIFPSAVFPNFGLGLFANYTTDASYDATTSQMSFSYREDLAAVFGFNFRMWDGRIKLGFNLKILNRNEIERTDIASTATGLTIKNLTSEGVAIASDVGLLISMPWKLIPTLGLVYRDAGNTHFTVRDGLLNGAATKPAPVPASLDAAFSIFPIAGKKTRIAFSTEVRDVLTIGDEEDINRRIHAGIELNIRDALFLRAGMNQRYWTAGIELAVANYQLQIASYGEEIGTATTPLEGRRYVGKFAYRF